MAHLLNSLDSGYQSFYIDKNKDETWLSRTYNDTHEFKIQLKKLKAHLNKCIQDAEEDELNATGNVKNINNEKEILKRAKKRGLVISKLNKASRQWNNNVTKQVKLSGIQYNKFKNQTNMKSHNGDLDSVYINKISEEYKNDIYLAIGYHIARYGLGEMQTVKRNEIETYLKDVYGLDEKVAAIYISMTEKINNIKTYNTKDCINDYDKNSDIYFEIYLLDIMILIKDKNILTTLEYLRKSTSRSFFNNKSSIIVEKISPFLTKVMLGLEVENIDELLNQQVDICVDLVSKDYCKQNKISFDSSLFSIILSGIISLQFFIKYNNIQKALHVDWTTKNELPFNVKLPESVSKFHSIFICPVLKEETTIENPPYSLPCHHVISRKALDKLSKNGTISFKCPYCPVAATISKTMKVNFILL
ncbi:hypothetical protein TPHA_0C01710 [Tetrapisispora phaffii CBS 4417]|uniref:GID complex catalytic subunit 2 n=1 Tax=Tetrapisispora phaffii (strain ATCC 24235 / CBS 4417 / NBRC 1672 / NRRL Y-8282 / UCD 70-5) TaxID=1071381 RepID=G8BRF1_TETPH|nr:hypothetical protein TPHA_0C01710 [Tetrapisispora phaffii CBS 4417]CCE62327.1 hypothetical protein TPHA_0C01710 [Tetrapisispora phaffii CBS 4417]